MTQPWRHRSWAGPAGPTSTSARSTPRGAGRRRRAEGRQRPPRHGDEPRARRLPALPERHAARPVRLALARPRPVRPLLRALQPDPVHPALPRRATACELDDLKALRTWGSQTPGHPEVHHTDGVEITTGPLGSGPGLRGRHGVGAAPRSAACSTPTPRRARARSTTTSTCSPPTATSWRASPPRPARSPATSSSATSSLIYDDNHISIEDDTDISFSEDVAKRYEAYGWHVADGRLARLRGGRRAYTEDVDALLRRHRARQGR